MDVGISLSTFAAAPQTANVVDEAVALGRQAAGFGVRSLWFGQMLSYDAVALAAFVGRAVPELQVGTSVLPVFARHPLLVAGQAQTAQAATGGRFRLGVGLGTKALTEESLGARWERPVARLREFLTVVRTFVDTGEVHHHGELITAATRGPSGVAGAGSTLPLLVAAMGPQALRVTGELADGTIPFLAGPRTLAEHIVPVVTEAARRAGRPAPRIVAAVPALVTADVAAAREKALQQFAFYEQVPSYQRVLATEGVERAADIAVIGDEETVARRLRAYIDAGATELTLSGTDLLGAADRIRTWELAGSLSGSA